MHHNTRPRCVGLCDGEVVEAWSARPTSRWSRPTPSRTRRREEEEEERGQIPTLTCCYLATDLWTVLLRGLGAGLTRGGRLGVSSLQGGGEGERGKTEKKERGREEEKKRGKGRFDSQA